VEDPGLVVVPDLIPEVVLVLVQEVGTDTEDLVLEREVDLDPDRTSALENDVTREARREAVARVERQNNGKIRRRFQTLQPTGPNSVMIQSRDKGAIYICKIECSYR